MTYLDREHVPDLPEGDPDYDPDLTFDDEPDDEPDDEDATDVAAGEDPVEGD
jgi:hypothetical protein